MLRLIRSIDVEGDKVVVDGASLDVATVVAVARSVLKELTNVDSWLLISHLSAHEI